VIYVDREGQRFVIIKVFRMKGWGARLTHQQSTNTLANGADGPSEIKIWPQTLKCGDLSCKNLPRAGRQPLTLAPQLEAFLLQKYPFASARVIAQHFLTTVRTVKDILQRELGMKRISRRSVPHLMNDAQKVTGVEASEEMLRILQSSQRYDFDGITTGDES
jgi:hypothetical protein